MMRWILARVKKAAVKSLSRLGEALWIAGIAAVAASVLVWWEKMVAFAIVWWDQIRAWVERTF